MSEIHERVMEFAKEFAKTKVRVYADRNQTDQKKIVMDCYYSKLAEFAAWKYLTDFLPNHPQYKPIGQPCIKVLDRWNRTRTAFGLFIQTKRSRRTWSWLWQSTGTAKSVQYR